MDPAPTATIHEDRERCAATGFCVSVAPGSFALSGDDGRVELRRATVHGADLDPPRDAASRCPRGAITVEERSAKDTAAQ